MDSRTRSLKSREFYTSLARIVELFDTVLTETVTFVKVVTIVGIQVIIAWHTAKDASNNETERSLVIFGRALVCCRFKAAEILRSDKRVIDERNGRNEPTCIKQVKAVRFRQCLMPLTHEAMNVGWGWPLTFGIYLISVKGEYQHKMARDGTYHNDVRVWPM